MIRDAENDPITAQLVTPLLPGNTGLSPDGAIVYTPTVDFEGVITFTYAVTDDVHPVPVNAPATADLTIQPDIRFCRHRDQDDVTDFAIPPQQPPAPLMQLLQRYRTHCRVSAEVAMLPVKPKPSISIAADA